MRTISTRWPLLSTHLFSPFIMSTGNQNLTQQVVSLCLRGQAALYTVCDGPTPLDQRTLNTYSIKLSTMLAGYKSCSLSLILLEYVSCMICCVSVCLHCSVDFTVWQHLCSYTQSAKVYSLRFRTKR